MSDSLLNADDPIKKLLIEKAESYARARGALRVFAPDEGVKLEGLDRGFRQLLESYSKSLEGKEETLEEIFLRAQDQYEETRLEMLEMRLSSIAQQIGHQLSMRGEQSSIQPLDKEFNRIIQSQRDLFDIYPDLNKAISDLKSEFINEGLKERLYLERVAVNIHSLIRPVVKSSSICSELELLTEQQIELLKKIFLDRYGVTLLSKFQEALGGLTLQRVFTLLSGERARYYAMSLFLLMNRPWPGRFSKVVATLLKIPITLRSEVKQIFDNEFAGRLLSWDLFEAFRRTFPNKDELILTGIFNAEIHDGIAQIIRSLLTMNYIEELRVYLLTVNPLDLELGLKRYKKFYKRELLKALIDQIDEKPVRDELIGIIQRDEIKAKAARLRYLLGHPFRSWVSEIFVGEEVSFAREVITRYGRMYKRNFWVDLKRVVRDSEFRVVRSLVEDGDVDLIELLNSCMEGFGTDEEGIKRLLASLTPTEIEEVKKEYGNRFAKKGVPADLIKDLRAELSGDDWLDVQDLLEPRATKITDQREALVKRHKRERGGGLLKRFDIFTIEGGVMDRDVAELISKLSTRKDSVKEEVKDPAFDLIELDFQVFRNSKTRVAHIIANIVAAFLAAITAISLGTMKVPVLLIIMGSASSSMAGRALVKRLLKGQVYGREEILWDTLAAMIDGGSLFVSRFITGFIAPRLVRSALRAGLHRAAWASKGIGTKRVSKHFLSGHILARRNRSDRIGLAEILKGDKKVNSVSEPDEYSKGFYMVWDKVIRSTELNEPLYDKEF